LPLQVFFCCCCYIVSFSVALLSLFVFSSIEVTLWLLSSISFILSLSALQSCHQLQSP
jgi:hypothetical protein